MKYLAVIGIILVITSIISNYIFILTEKQIKELWIGTILMIVLLFSRNEMLNMETDLYILPMMYLIWYILTRVSANIINRDEDIIQESYDNNEVITSTIMFMIVMFLWKMLMNEKIDSKDVILTTILFFVWIMITYKLV